MAVIFCYFVAVYCLKWCDLRQTWLRCFS